MATKKKTTNATKIAKNSTKKKATNSEEVKDVDTKAKQRVNQLIDDINLTTKEGDDELLELNEDNVKNLEWLQDQVSKLSEENEKLKKEAEQAKNDYKKLHTQYQELSKGSGQSKDLVPDSQLKNGVFDLFNEFQNNFIGNNPEKVRYTEIKLKHLMEKMIKRFPFLSEYRRF